MCVFCCGRVREEVRVVIIIIMILIISNQPKRQAAFNMAFFPLPLISHQEAAPYEYPYPCDWK